jgi:uncharacterized radical SAM protein YgiQ
MGEQGLFSYRKYWAKRFGVAEQLPMSRDEMEQLGWDSCDILLVTGDAYVDHPSFGMALIGRLLEAQGFRVGIISQPDWTDVTAFQTLGRPNLFVGVTAGNMDSMVNRYTADRRKRSDDAYTPGGQAGKRPDRSVVVYAQRCREAFKGTPIIVGGIEASLRRVAHYDYWSDKIRRSVLLDSRADMLVFGNAERQVVEIAHRLAKGEKIRELTDIRGIAYVCKALPEDREIDYQDELLGDNTQALKSQVIPATDFALNKGAVTDVATNAATTERAVKSPRAKRSHRDSMVMLPSYEKIKDNPPIYAHASRVFHHETNPGNARTLVQPHGDRYVVLNPPPVPLTSAELDALYELPYTRVPHTSYADARLPAYEMIRFSINIMRGCFGGCTFCSITEHEGRIIQSRSEKSIVSEIETIRDTVPGFTGTISDLGGPTANMYRLACKDKKIESACRRLSCVYPDICKHMGTDHKPLISLYRKAREIPGVKRVLVASGLRYDLAVRSPEYIKELVTHHVGGYLKIAPEHTESGPLSKMMKPGMDSYYKFKQLFELYSKEAGKEQYLIPYFIAAHPGTTDEDMLNLALWLKSNGFRLDQVQNFLPTPMALATTMYYSGKNPLRKVSKSSEPVAVPKGDNIRKLHKAFLRYHDPENWPLLRTALKKMGRADLIGRGKDKLVPNETYTRGRKKRVSRTAR